MAIAPSLIFPFHRREMSTDISFPNPASLSHMRRRKETTAKQNHPHGTKHTAPITTHNGTQQLGDNSLSPLQKLKGKKPQTFLQQSNIPRSSEMLPHQIKWMTDLGYRYKSKPAASGLQAHIWAHCHSSYFLSV